MSNLNELNLASIPVELNLIFDLLQENEKNVTENKYKNIEIKWSLFLQLAFHHRLYPILYKKLNEMENEWIPSTVNQQLKSSYQKNTFHMLFLFGEMEALNLALKEKEICALFLKGPLLAKDLYKDVSNRTCGDLDLLISIKDLHKVDEILIELGYKRDEYIKSLLGDWKWRHHHFTYFHSGKGTKVEIHWRLNPSPSKEPSFTDLWQRKRQYILKENPIHYLGKEDLFFFLVTHGARHGWSRLRWLMDIHQILDQNLDWGRIKHMLRKYQSEKLAGQALILSQSIFHSVLPRDAQRLTTIKKSKQLAQDAIFYLERMVSLHNHPVPVEISKFHARHLFTQMSFQQKILYLISILHPLYTDAEILPLPKKLHFLYFPLRPFLWLWKKKSRHVLS